MRVQVLEMMVFVKRFVEEHPLCVCSDEVNRIRAGLLRPADDMKLRQRSSQLLLRLRQGAYHLAVRLTVPDNYPVTQLGYGCEGAGWAGGSEGDEAEGGRVSPGREADSARQLPRLTAGVWLGGGGRGARGKAGRR